MNDRGLVVVCTLASALAGASSSRAAEPIRIAVVEPAGSEQASEDARRALGALVAARLGETGAFEVITQDDVRQMISFDKLKTALSCDEEASCLAEIGGALGVGWLVSGTLAEVGGVAVLSLSLVDIERARVERRETITAPDVAGLIGKLPPIVDALVRPLLSGRQGTLELKVPTEAALVEIDGRAVGQTPLPPVTLTQGSHRVVVRKAGYFDYSKDVEVTPGEMVTLDFTLARAELGDDLRFVAISGLVAAGGGAVLGTLGYGAALSFAFLLSRPVLYAPFAVWTLIPVVGGGVAAGMMYAGRKQPAIDGPMYILGAAVSTVQLVGALVLVAGAATWAVTAFTGGDEETAGGDGG